MHHADDRLLAPLDGADAVLEVGDAPPELRRDARRVWLRCLRPGRGRWWGGLGDQAGLRGCLDVEAGCEGFAAGAGEEDGADVGGVREGLEDVAEFEPHSEEDVRAPAVFGSEACGVSYASKKEFNFSGRLISTWATYSCGNVTLKCVYDRVLLEWSDMVWANGVYF